MCWLAPLSKIHSFILLLGSRAPRQKAGSFFPARVVSLILSAFSRLEFLIPCFRVFGPLLHVSWTLGWVRPFFLSSEAHCILLLLAFLLLRRTFSTPRPLFCYLLPSGRDLIYKSGSQIWHGYLIVCHTTMTMSAGLS